MLINKTLSKLLIDLLDRPGAVSYFQSSQLIFCNVLQASLFPKTPELLPIEFEQLPIVLQERLKHLHRTPHRRVLQDNTNDQILIERAWMSWPHPTPSPYNQAKHLVVRESCIELRQIQV